MLRLVRDGGTFPRLALASVMALLLEAGASAQISPGPLSKAHSGLAGVTHCLDCHKIGQAAPEFRCMACHQEVRQRAAAQRGFHGAVFRTNELVDRVCVSCHSEHNGENFSLIYWDGPVDKFDHRLTGYWLEGRHARLTCRQCHQPSRIAAAEAQTISTSLERTYLGLTRDCLSCHKDQHRGQLSPDCRRCHGFTSWKETPLFSHQWAAFPLAGRHENVACDKCHRPTSDAAGRYVQYHGVRHQDCTPCHTDPHHGIFASSCKSCHTLAGWKSNQAAMNFDHDRSDFPLRGKHTGLVCSSCHKGTDFKQPVAHQLCTDCHRKDPHAGQFTTAAGAADCSKCHTPDGFKPSSFDAAKHASTAFPLTGKHELVPCAKCHEPRGTETNFRIDGKRCANCHTDAHQGQFAQEFRNACEECHSVAGFLPTIFLLARHRSTRFPLHGAHVAVPCSDCHAGEHALDISQTPAAQARSSRVSCARFHFADLACTACHQDPHKGQFASRMVVLGVDRQPLSCAACHSVKAWKDTNGFDHSTTNFVLDGAHKGASCTACHLPGRKGSKLKDAVFSDAPRLCSGCHEDAHNGQFAEKRPADCGACHNTFWWRPSIFDHATHSTFKLDGAHAQVPCTLCHEQVRQVDGRTIRIYRPTPRKCSVCHGATA
jgi:predicted CXXCH cytochrome family protein